MTGYVRLYPVSNKNAHTSVECFKNWVFTFGAPKHILTDRGTEFVNQIIKGFNKSIGVEHSLTAAYNPRTNGKTERAGQSLMNSLRKHCESNQSTWDQWLPYIEFSYNTRVHSTTGFSPYELVFGKKPNLFNSLNEDELSSNEQNELQFRSLQIKDLVEKTRPKAIDNNLIAKERQKTNQDKNQNVTTESLPKNTTVLLKNDKNVKKKLDSRYQGNYQVVEQDQFNNYILKDITG